MARKLFCEIHPVTYQISVMKNILRRKLQDLFNRIPFALTKTEEPLSHLIYKHNSLIRRKLGNVRLDLQENKATNLNIAAPKVSGITIKPGEVFSFWKLVGSVSKRKGYKEGLLVGLNFEPKSGVGGTLPVH